MSGEMTMSALAASSKITMNCEIGTNEDLATFRKLPI